MIDLTKKALPNTLIVNGKAYSIYTDYRVWLRFMIEVDEKQQGFDVSYLFKNEMPEKVSIADLMTFASPKTELPRKIESSNEILFDFKLDSDLIFSAFMGQYGIDLLETDLHWHKFLALLSGITEGTKLSEVMGYRAYSKNDSKSDPYEKMQRAWKIDKKHEDSALDIEAAKEFESLFI